MHCANCGKVNNRSETFCKHCGRKIYVIPKNKEFYCVSCGSLNQRGNQVCHNCNFDFSKIESYKAGLPNAYNSPNSKIDNENYNTATPTIFMNKNLFVFIALILVALWAGTLFLPWYIDTTGAKMNLYNYSKDISEIQVKDFWINVGYLWCFLPYMAIVLSFITTIRRRLYSIPTYSSFAFCWIIGFVFLNIWNKWTTVDLKSILLLGEISFVGMAIIMLLFGKLLSVLNISEN